MTSNGALYGKIAYVTGGSSGIGASVARLLKKRGVTVVIIDNHEPVGEIPWRRIDLADPEAISEGFEDLQSQVGAADILVCSAGINANHAISGHSVEVWDTVLAVNLSGTFHSIRACLPKMMDKKWGRIVTLTSGGALRVLPNRAAYAASKAGVTAITKAAAMEGASHGVTVNAIAPGLTNTAMARSMYGSDKQTDTAVTQSLVANPMGVLLEPHDIANGVDYLCSESARYVTGQVLSINAGGLM